MQKDSFNHRISDASDLGVMTIRPSTRYTHYVRARDASDESLYSRSKVELPVASSPSPHNVAQQSSVASTVLASEVPVSFFEEPKARIAPTRETQTQSSSVPSDGVTKNDQRTGHYRGAIYKVASIKRYLSNVQASIQRASVPGLGQFRVFAAGGMFAVGLIATGYYMGVSRPQVSAPTSTVLSSSISVDEGINVDDVDTSAPVVVQGSIPNHIVIPSVGIDAQIRSVGRTDDGAVAVTPTLDQVGWYKYSKAPGDGGNTLIVGHYNLEKPAAFKNLKDVTEGTEIQVTRGDGAVVTYKVTAKDIYQKDQTPMDSILQPTDKDTLHIITCDGAWLSQEKTFDQRLVVTAIRI
jgi:LPXTG-site transpeptidase (sortase) family protein